MAFKVGDVVRLKSGGPRMTVESISKDEMTRGTIWCVWFDKTDRKSGTFPEDALETATDSSGAVTFGRS
jgi:uncharacterized protein YodC (DUF2158 family)